MATVVPTHLAAAVPEVAVYLKESVGNSTRIDYGTGTCHSWHALGFTATFSWAASSCFQVVSQGALSKQPVWASWGAVVRSARSLGTARVALASSTRGS